MLKNKPPKFYNLLRSIRYVERSTRFRELQLSRQDYSLARLGEVSEAHRVHRAHGVRINYSKHSLNNRVEYLKTLAINTLIYSLILYEEFTL